jgi:hypothetical protein
MLPVSLTNAGLAAVMGHEVAHAVLRHGSERVSQSLVVAGVMLTLDQAMRDSNRKPYVLAALGLGAQVGVILPYGRKQERPTTSDSSTWSKPASTLPRPLSSGTAWPRPEAPTRPNS